MKNNNRLMSTNNITIIIALSVLLFAADPVSSIRVNRGIPGFGMYGLLGVPDLIRGSYNLACYAGQMYQTYYSKAVLDTSKEVFDVGKDISMSNEQMTFHKISFGVHTANSTIFIEKGSVEMFYEECPAVMDQEVSAIAHQEMCAPVFNQTKLEKAAEEITKHIPEEAIIHITGDVQSYQTGPSRVLWIQKQQLEDLPYPRDMPPLSFGYFKQNLPWLMDFVQNFTVEEEHQDGVLEFVQDWSVYKWIADKVKGSSVVTEEAVESLSPFLPFLGLGVRGKKSGFAWMCMMVAFAFTSLGIAPVATVFAVVKAVFQIAGGMLVGLTEVVLVGSKRRGFWWNLFHGVVAYRWAIVGGRFFYIYINKNIWEALYDVSWNSVIGLATFTVIIEVITAIFTWTRKTKAIKSEKAAKVVEEEEVVSKPKEVINAIMAADLPIVEEDSESEVSEYEESGYDSSESEKEDPVPLPKGKKVVPGWENAIVVASTPTTRGSAPPEVSTEDMLAFLRSMQWK